jgi:hypothetical protein
VRSVIPLFTGSNIMTKNKILLRWTLIVVAIMIPLLYAWYIHYQRNHFSCEAHTRIVDDNYVLDVMLSYQFNGGSGSYETTGEYIPTGKPPVSMSNKIAFDYWRDAKGVIMVANETNELPKKYEAFRSTIPDFYHLRSRGLRVKITPANPSSYIFSYGGAPVFYCSKG